MNTLMCLLFGIHVGHFIISTTSSRTNFPSFLRKGNKEFGEYSSENKPSGE